MADYEAIIGLETHIQLNTVSKIFCGCKTDSWQDPPNTNICPICTGLPGALPALNQAVVEKAVLLAAAVHAEEIRPRSYFAHKNYFPPALPRVYQISQYGEPLARGGFFDLPLPGGRLRRGTIPKLHVEEDAGKTLHRGDRRLIDFNRCGVPLVEMVTGPDLRSADEVAQYLIRLRQLLRWLGISDADMERGQLRCDANVSIRPAGQDRLNPKTEIKNVNSITNVRDALQAEFERQIREPDLPPIVLESEWKARILQGLPELPLERRRRFVEHYGLPEYDAEILTDERSLSEYFEQAAGSFSGEPKIVSNWLMNDVLRLIREQGRAAGALQLTPGHLARIIEMVSARQITASTGKELLEQVEASGRAPDDLVKEQALAQLSDEASLRELARGVLQSNPQQIELYRSGKTTLLGWFVGQVMRETGGQADPQIARKVLQDLL